MPLEQKLISL